MLYMFYKIIYFTLLSITNVDLRCLHMRGNLSHYPWLQWLLPITWSETSWFETHVAYHSLDGRHQIRVNIILLYQTTMISANVMKRDMVSPGSLCVTLTTPGTFIYSATDVNAIPCANDAQCHVRRGRNANVRHWRRCWADYVNDADVNAEILRRERLRVICSYVMQPHVCNSKLQLGCSCKAT